MGRAVRLRVVGARARTVLAILLALVGMLAFYVPHTALDDARGVRPHYKPENGTFTVARPMGVFAKSCQWGDEG